MNQTQAIAKLRKVLGPKVGYRTDTKALKADGRAEAHEAAKTIRAQKTAVKDAMEMRRAELLRDSAYQALRAEYKRLEDEHNAACWKAGAHPITVGTLSGMFFSVKAEGDNWDEVVAKVSEK